MVDFYASGPAGASPGAGSILPGTGSRPGVWARPWLGTGLPPAVWGEWGIRRWIAAIVPCEHGSKEAEIFLVAIQGQDIAHVVGRLLLVIWMALALRTITIQAKEWWHPVAMLIGVEEGEVEGLRPADRQQRDLGFRIAIGGYYQARSIV